MAIRRVMCMLGIALRFLLGLEWLGIGYATLEPDIATTDDGWQCPPLWAQRRSKLHRLHLPRWNAFVDNAGKLPSISANKTVLHSNLVENAVAALHEDLGARGMHMNGLLIGACDGTHDSFVDFLRAHHDTAAMLVEPVPHNFDDLVEALVHNATWRPRGRIRPVRAAMHAACTLEGGTRDFTFMPREFETTDLLQEKFQRGKPHWIRRQIGSLSPGRVAHLNRHFANVAKTEAVTCLSPNRLMQRYIDQQASLLRNLLESCTPTFRQDGGQVGAGAGRALGPIVRRHLADLHVLKIDVEGQDYNIIKGFLDQVLCAECTVVFDGRLSNGGGSRNNTHDKSNLAISASFSFPGIHFRPLLIQYEEKIFLAEKMREPGDILSGEEKAESLKAELKAMGYSVFNLVSGDVLAMHKLEIT